MAATRVRNPDEISINGAKYKVKGGIKLSLASQWPEKQITGDYIEDSHPLVSIHAWDDQRGGIGVDRWKGPEDDNRAWYSECWLRNRNHLLLPPLLTDTAAYGSPTGYAAAATTFNTVLLVAFNNTIRSLSAIGGSWSSNLQTMSDPTDAVTCFANGSQVAVFADVTEYYYTTNGSTFTSSSKDVVKLAVWDNRLWGLDASGQLWYTFTPGSAEVNNAILPLIQGAQLSLLRGSLFVGPDTTGEPILYALTEEGLYAHDVTNSRFIRTNIFFPRCTDRTVRAVADSAAIYILTADAIYKYVPTTGTFDNISPSEDDGLPATYEPYWRGIAIVAGHLFVSSENRSSATSTIIAEHVDGKWQIVYATTQTDPISLLWVLYVSSSLYLIAEQESTPGVVSYIPLRNLGAMPKLVTGWTYASSAVHKYPWFDAGQNEVTKSLLEVRVTTQDCDSNDTVKVELATDYTEGSADASYTTLGTITTNGTTTYRLDSDGLTTGDPTGYDFVALRLKLTLTGGASTTSPDVSRVAVVFRKKLPPKYQIECKLDLSGPSPDGRSPKEQRAALVTAAERTELTEVTFKDDTASGNPRNYWCDILSLSGLEKSGDAEDGLVDFAAVEI